MRVSKRDYRELYMCWGRKKRWIYTLLVIALSIFLILWSLAIMSLFLLICDIIYVIIGVLYYWVIWPNYIAYKRQKQDRSLLKSDICSEVFFFENAWMEVDRRTNSTSELTYDMITEVRESENLYLLFCSNSICCVFDKWEFDVGNSDDFLKFIEVKAFQAKMSLRVRRNSL